MKIDLIPEGLLITPETDFEENYIDSFGTGVLKCFIKHGVDPTHTIGIKIVREGVDVKNNNASFGPR